MESLAFVCKRSNFEFTSKDVSGSSEHPIMLPTRIKVRSTSSRDFFVFMVGRVRCRRAGAGGLTGGVLSRAGALFSLFGPYRVDILDVTEEVFTLLEFLNFALKIFYSRLGRY